MYEVNQPLDRDLLKTNLQQSLVKVSFEKTDGSMRTMTCTLDSTYLPESNSSESSKKNFNSVAVWDVDKNAWRSFRYDSVKFISYKA
jgi:hypothetical protein